MSHHQPPANRSRFPRKTRGWTWPLDGAGWILALAALACLGGAGEARAAGPAKPNIVFILADDLGYGDLGCFGQKKIRTPNLDRMAAEGMRFTAHYAGSPVCAPSRCVLLTGRHPGHAFIRDNREVQPEGQLALPAATVTLARLLQQQGYATGAFGKWGLGAPGSEGAPLQQGFDRFFGYLCQRLAHNHYPAYLWDNDRRRPLGNPVFSAHQKLPAGAGTNDPAAYTNFVGREYAPDLILEQARRFVRENRDRPFFLFVPTTIPHLALQVPEDSLREYLGQWPDPPYAGGKSYLPHYSPRAAYAAMITRLDREVGRLLSLVQELGLDERTLFIFTSDNGPLYDQLGGTDTDFFGSAAAWRGRKGSVYEGGLRVPLVVRWPGRVPAGATAGRVTGFEDWLPTLLELAGAAAATPKDIDGFSFAPTLRGEPQAERPFLYREFAGYSGQQWLRMGDWVAVRQNLARLPAGSPLPPLTELYNLQQDPREIGNQAARQPDLLAAMDRLLREQHRPSREFPQPVLDQPAGAR